MDLIISFHYISYLRETLHNIFLFQAIFNQEKIETVKKNFLSTQQKDHVKLGLYV